MEWLPGTGPMTFSMALTGLYALVVTVLALLLGQIGAAKRRGAPPVFGGAALALAGAGLAFGAGHFLLRYVALEIVALCVALAPLLVLRDVEGKRSSWAVYLMLRIGDAGLLAAILALYGAAGTLDIDAALAAGKSASPARLGWIAAGFALAVWVKLGVWPFSLWLHAGRRLPDGDYTWFYLTLMPNLGLYLLYKVASLLAAAGPVAVAVQWVGVAGALISVLLALLRRGSDRGEIALWSIQGGLVIWAAASGLQPAVWVGLILWTPLRLLSTWAFDLAGAPSGRARRVGAGALSACGVALAAWNGLLLAWTRPAAGAAGWFAAQLASLLALLWVGRAAWQARNDEPAWSRYIAAKNAVAVRPAQAEQLSLRTLWAAGGLELAAWVGLALARPLLDHLFEVAHAGRPAWPAWGDWAHALVWTPALPAALVLAWLAHRLGGRAKLDEPARITSLAARTSLNLALGVRVIVEWGMLEGIIGWVARVAMGASAWLHRWLELGGLEGSLRGSVRIVERASAWALRWLELGSLEESLHRAVAGVRAVAQGAQRLHTGRLRANLAWVVLSLAALVLAFVFLFG